MIHRGFLRQILEILAVIPCCFTALWRSLLYYFTVCFQCYSVSTSNTEYFRNKDLKIQSISHPKGVFVNFSAYSRKRSRVRYNELTKSLAQPVFANEQRA